MKIIKIILFTFIIAFLTTALYEFKFINLNPVRYALVILLIVIELITGFCYAAYQLKLLIKTLNTNQPAK